MHDPLKPTLRKAVEFLEKEGVRYAIVGGIALSQWGVVRVTRDIDIKVLVPDTDYESARSTILQTFPIRAREEVKNPLILPVNIDGVIVDFLFALPGYEEQIIERAPERDFNGIRVRVCTAEDLIIQKAVAGRKQDWSDIEALLAEQLQKLDHEYIETWLAEFAEALDDNEFLSEYHALLARIRSLS